jgi:hypothetical protein
MIAAICATAGRSYRWVRERYRCEKRRGGAQKEAERDGRMRETAARCMPPIRTLVNIIKYNINSRK